MVLMTEKIFESMSGLVLVIVSVTYFGLHGMNFLGNWWKCEQMQSLKTKTEVSRCVFPGSYVSEALKPERKSK
jgi:hypothetical protein